MYPSLSFEMFIHVMKYHRDESYSFLEFLKSTWVCQGWRDRIIAAPSLWTGIQMNVHPELVRMQFERSRPLNVHVRWRLDDDQSTLLPTVAEAAGRMESLELLVGVDGLDAVTAILGQHELSALRRLALAGPAVEDSTLPPLEFPHGISASSLESLQLTNVSFNTSDLLPWATSLDTFSLDNSNFEKSAFKLESLVSTLSRLTTLRRVSLSVKIQGTVVKSRNRRTTPPPPLSNSSLKALSFTGRSKHLERLLARLEVPNVEEWHVDVTATEGNGGIGLHPIVHSMAPTARRVDLRWGGWGRSQVCVFSGEQEPRQELKVTYYGLTPLDGFTILLGDYVRLDSVSRLLLHGGPPTPHMTEPDDDITMAGMKAIPNIRSLEMCGNHISWGRLPVALARLWGEGNMVWRKLVRLEMSSGIVFGYIMEDWSKWFAIRKREGVPLKTISYSGAVLDGALNEERRTVTDLIDSVVKETEGGLLLVPGNITPNDAWDEFRGREIDTNERNEDEV